MLRKISSITLMVGLLFSAASMAQTSPAAPAGSTGLCRDGSYWSGPVKKGACHGHKGVQDWYAAPAAPAPGSAEAPAAPSAAAPAAPAAPAATASSAAAATPAVAAVSTAKQKATPPAAAAPGGGPGQVWVNTSSKVYHCPSDRWYGKTKNGSYMTEAQATAQGNRPDHGKACQ